MAQTYLSRHGMPGITLGGAAAIQVVGAALPKLAERGSSVRTTFR
jgi:hypothetical protein